MSAHDDDHAGSDSEKRSSPRYHVDMPVSCEVQGVTRFARAVNLSKGGVFLRSALPYPVGSVARMTFELPDSGETVVCEGEIRHVQTGRRPGMNVAFVDLGGNQVEVLEEFLSIRASHIEDDDEAVTRSIETILSEAVHGDWAADDDEGDGSADDGSLDGEVDDDEAEDVVNLATTESEAVAEQAEPAEATDAPPPKKKKKKKKKKKRKKASD